jgi:inhibitor of KinA sporulation pathway (predicted exonuclease)
VYQGYSDYAIVSFVFVSIFWNVSYLNFSQTSSSAMFLRTGSVVVFDLEWTSWSGFRDSNWSLPGKHREIIQIGAVKIDCEDGFSEIGHFDQLIKPTRNPELSAYVQELTGISQSDVEENGIEFPHALSEFNAFCSAVDYVCCNGADGEVIVENCILHAIETPKIFTNAIDLNPLLSDALGVTERWLYSSELTSHLGLPSVGEQHNGLADARGIASAIRHLMLNHLI